MWQHNAVAWYVGLFTYHAAALAVTGAENTLQTHKGFKLQYTQRQNATENKKMTQPIKQMQQPELDAKEQNGPNVMQTKQKSSRPLGGVENQTV